MFKMFILQINAACRSHNTICPGIKAVQNHAIARISKSSINSSTAGAAYILVFHFLLSH